MIRVLTSVVAMLLALAPGVVRAATVDVIDAWSRPATGTGVVYATILNRSLRPDRLVGGSSPLAARLELHETTSKGSGNMASMGNVPMAGRMTTMAPVSFVTIPAGGRVLFSPGGYHIMLVGLRHDLRAGESVPLRLHFARAGWYATSARVRPF